MTHLTTAVLLAVPVGVLGVALFLTRRLVSDDPVVVPAVPWQYSFVRAELLVVLPATALFFLPPLRAWRTLVVSCALLLLAALHVRALSASRRAARPVVAMWIGFAAFWGAGMLSMGSSAHASVIVARPLLTLALGTLALVAIVLARRAVAVRHAASLVVVMVLLSACLVALAAAETVRGTPDREDAADWVDAFAAPVDDLTAWERFGNVAGWLRRRGLADVEAPAAARTVREAIAAGTDVHPSTFDAAFEAGLLGPAVLAPLRDTQEYAWSRPLLEEDANESHVRTIMTPARVRLLVGLGEVDEAARQRLAARLASAWPTDTGIGRLEDCYELCLLFEELGAEERVAAHADALRALLVRSFCAEAPSFSQPGGFSVYDDGEVHASDLEATWWALELMQRVGVPEPVDLDRVERYLTAEAETGALGPLFPRERARAQAAGFALLRLRTEHEIARGATWWRESLPPALAILACLVFGVFVLVPSPPATVRRLDQIPSRYPADLLAAFPEIRRMEEARRAREVADRATPPAPSPT